jgi:hypothetical protein
MTTEKYTRILGIGAYGPDRVVSNDQLSETVDTSNEWIRSRTGILERRFGSEEQSTSDLALEAAQKALDHAGVLPDEIDLVLVATITPDMAFPSTACLLQHKLGLRKVACLDLESCMPWMLLMQCLHLDGIKKLWLLGQKRCQVSWIGKTELPACCLETELVRPFFLKRERDLHCSVFTAGQMDPTPLFFVNLQEVLHCQQVQKPFPPESIS